MSKHLTVKDDFSSGGVVWDDAGKKLLLIRVENLSGTHVWTFPKGHPEKGENDAQAAVREVLEETGWRADVVKPVTDVHYTYSHEGTLYKKTVRWFLMRPVEEVGAFDGEEVLEVRWVSFDDAAKLVTYGSDKDLLKQIKLLL